ncbi:MAG: PSD1 domain-containing protein [Verrucomicrobia bacterium]|nr:PSD1 domain-containing protein [Verrucomicrobiota bacterium]
MKRTATRRLAVRLLLVAAVGRAMLSARAAEPTAEEIAFFERKIRPVLIERCFKCHSAEAEKLKGELFLDSREALLKGGESGPAIVPGEPEKSRLIEAIRYGNVDLQMPPKGRLSDDQIAALTEWVKLGAPWPREVTKKSSGKKDNFDIAKRRQEHWAWRPIQASAPPSVANKTWPRNSIDQFLLAKLEAKHLTPAPAAEKRTLIRRLCFDLVGLPPSVEETETFVADAAPDAYEKLVDRLLASPAFGERWARHWLDLVRYSETLGHEFDYPLPNAWRYRDYVIRAFNDDVPYDQFATEHIAGDLLPNPRRHPAEGFNESIIAPGFFWFGQQTHSPVDVRQHQAEFIDNQIDVLAKTFLGLTVACARCHDHKFDAISTRDYYSLYGIFSSSRYAQRAIDAPDAIARRIQELAKLKPRLRIAAADRWRVQAGQIQNYLLAAAQLNGGASSAISELAAQFKLNAARLTNWANALRDTTLAEASHPLFAWKQLTATNATDATVSFDEKWNSFQQAENTRSVSPGSNAVVFADFRTQDFRNWFLDGEAFGNAPARAGDFAVGATNQNITGILTEPAAHSGVLARQLQGALRSPTFVITNRYLHLLVAGRDSRVNVFVDNFAMIQDPIYGGLRRVIDHDQFQWLTIDVSMWPGHRAYFEFSDIPTGDLSGGGKPGGYGPNGYLAVRQIIFSDDKQPPREASSLRTLLGDDAFASLEQLAERYAQAAREALELWKRGTVADSPNTRAQLALLDWLVGHGLLERSPAENSEHSADSFASLLAEYQTLAASIPNPARAPAMADGSGLDENVFIRGNPKHIGERVPRRFLEALAGDQQGSIANGSGRLELAQRLLDPANPFPARVMVNRVWHHLFGRGLVPSVDNFGVLGQTPTHLELLDWLAGWYRSDAGWSTKKLIRLLVTSSAYRMSSRADDALAEQKDPTDELLHRMRVRRLEGEAIRDAVLAVSGRLDQKMFGPSMPVHLTPFMDGRGRPDKSGVLDGDGRRSLYVETRRNFLSPMMLAFDTPIPATTVGRRSESNVPAQALIMMNDPFVVQQSEIWAKQLLADGGSPATQRVQRMYRAAFGRPPTEREASDAIHFLDEQAKAYGLAKESCANDLKLWADLCHVLFNVKEFVFVN